MLVPCPECGHELWTRMGSIGIFGLVVFFDHGAQSGPYTEEVDRCPGCGLWLHTLDIKPSEVGK